VPYYCARDNVTIAYGDCVKNPENTDITTMVSHTRRYADNGLIDPTRYMINDRVYIYHGLNDTIIVPGHSRS